MHDPYMSPEEEAVHGTSSTMQMGSANLVSEQLVTAKYKEQDLRT